MRNEVKIGDVFGYLRVLEVYSKKRISSNRTDFFAKCECKCGNICEKKTINLLCCKYDGNCRCKAKAVKSGDKFGLLTVVKKAKTEIHCKCDCGNDYVSPSVSHLMRMKKQNRSCGCTWIWKKGKNNGRWLGYEELPNKYWHRLVAGARIRGIKLQLTKKQIWDLFVKQNRKCVFSGVLLQFLDNTGAMNITASLDRIDSNKDYTIDNVQWVHKDTQFMKQDMSDKEFINWCHTISRYQLDLPGNCTALTAA